MRKRGICPICGFDKYLGDRRICKPCSYSTGECVECAHLGKIYVDGLCYCCYQSRQVMKQILKIKKGFRPRSDYNGYLFDLYLAYITRYRLQYYHVKQARLLSDILEQDVWSTIRSWQDIYRISARYDLAHENGKANGCAVKKIGYMLQELGILSPKDRDSAASISSLVDHFEIGLREDIEAYHDWMVRSARTESTILCNLRSILKFSIWIKEVYPQIEFKLINEAKAIEYLEFLKEKGFATSQIRRSLQSIRRYYAWLRYRKKTFINPLEGMDISRHQGKINIIDDDDLHSLKQYIKQPSTDPESALCLALILFWGFRTDDLLHASIESEGSQLSIILSMRECSYGHHYFNRDQKLTLPDHPPWFNALKRRFLKQWKQRYEKTKTTFQLKPLLLAKNGVHARGITEKTLLKRLKQASKSATGMEINPNVLRQTCGHLYSANGDGSVLSRMGWSPQMGFAYTWLPRTRISEKAAENPE